MSQKTRMQTEHHLLQHCYCIKSGFASWLPNNECTDDLARQYFLQIINTLKAQKWICIFSKWWIVVSFRRLTNLIYITFLHAVFLFLLKDIFYNIFSTYKKEKSSYSSQTNISGEKNKVLLLSVYNSLAKHMSFHTKDGLPGPKVFCSCCPDFHLLHLFRSPFQILIFSTNFTAYIHPLTLYY